MHKDKNIIWSPRAEYDFAETLEYLSFKWGNKVCNKFIDLLDNKLENIKKNPLTYPPYDKNRNIHRCVVSKHNVLYYSVSKNGVELLTIFNTSQSPDKLNL